MVPVDDFQDSKEIPMNIFIANLGYFFFIFSRKLVNIFIVTNLRKDHEGPNRYSSNQEQGTKKSRTSHQR